eukprot:362877-Chlamydomonas_euryale.AAC.6
MAWGLHAATHKAHARAVRLHDKWHGGGTRRSEGPAWSCTCAQAVHGTWCDLVYVRKRINRTHPLHPTDRYLAGWRCALGSQASSCVGAGFLVLWHAAWTAERRDAFPTQSFRMSP